MIKLITRLYKVIKRTYYNKRVLLQFIVPDTIYKIKFYFCKFARVFLATS